MSEKVWGELSTEDWITDRKHPKEQHPLSPAAPHCYLRGFTSWEFYPHAFASQQAPDTYQLAGKSSQGHTPSSEFLDGWWTGMWECCPEGEGAMQVSFVLGNSIRTKGQLLSWVLVVKWDEGYLGSEPAFETPAWEDANPNLEMPMFSPWL